jgi:hypothetical protein
MNTMNMEESLWNFIDGTAGTEERNVIEKLVQSDTEWKAKYHELLELDRYLKSTELEAPSMRFTRNVMEEISRLHIAPATKTYINKKIIWGIGFFFIALLVGFLVYGFGQMTFTGGEQTNISKNLGKIDFSKFFNNTWINIFMMVNVVLVLIFLDHFLANKRKEYQKEA